MNCVENDLLSWLESEKSDYLIEPFMNKIPIIEKDIIELKKMSKKSFWEIFIIMLEIHMVSLFSYKQKNKNSTFKKLIKYGIKTFIQWQKNLNKNTKFGEKCTLLL